MVTDIMLTVYYKEDKKIETDVTITQLEKINLEELLWIDLLAPTPEERKVVEELLSIKFLTRQQAEEIESTSKYSESFDHIYVNTNYYIDKGKTYETEPVSFIINQNGLLVSYHQLKLSALNDVATKLKLRPDENKTGYGVFMTIFESFIDYDADMEELLTREITRLSKVITSSSNIDKAILHRINELQEKSTALREDVYDVERIVSGLLRSQRFLKESDTRISLMLKDAESLINHGDISFARLDYLQDTAMGLINIEQNEIMKILSIAAVVFMPPTLIASIFGMNFKYMPELESTLGYPTVIVVSLLIAIGGIIYFKKKKWL